MHATNTQFRLVPAALLALAACGPSGRSSELGAPPKNLHYSTSAAIYARDAAIAPNTPAVTGEVAKYTVQPALPAGLAIDAKSGIISGTPTAIAELGEYQVTAQNGAGKTSTALRIGVTFPTRFAVVGNSGDQTLGLYTLDSATGEWRPHGFRTHDEPNGAVRAIVAHPTLHVVYVLDESANSLVPYALDPARGTLAPGAAVATGLGPRSLVFDREGCHAYVACAQDSTIETYAIDPASGMPTRVDPPLALAGSAPALRLAPDGRTLYAAITWQDSVQALSVDPATHALALLGAPSVGGDAPVDLEIDPLGRFLYAADLRSHDLGVFAIQPDGSLIARAPIATGSFPADVAIDPTGRFLYVCESGIDRVHGFAIDQASGGLAELDSGVPAGTRPVAIELDATGEHLYALDLDGNRTWTFPVDVATGALGAPYELHTRDQPLTLGLIRGEHPATPRPRFAYVANTGSQDLSVYASNPDTGILTSISPSVYDQGSPRAVLAALDGRHVYSLNAGSNDVHPFAVDPVTGEVSAIGARLPLSGVPAAGAIDASGRFLFAAIGDANRIDVFSLDPVTGAPAPAGWAPTSAGPAALAVDATGRFLYVANYAANSIGFYRIDPRTGALTPAPVELVVPGQPSSLVCHPNGRRLYAVIESSATAVSFDIDPFTGELSSPSTQTTEAAPMSIALDARGRFAYTANFVSGAPGDVGVFRIEPTTGDLVPLGTTLAGQGPVALVGDPSGRVLYSVNGDENTVTIYGIHQATGALSVGATIGTGIAPRSLALIGTLE
jgi:6-phosphogluconolactonase (cycloisomerase 2 family)